MEIKLNVPKYLEERFGKLEAEEDLIDDCKYILYFADGWGMYEGYEEPSYTVPVRSKKEAIEFLKDAVKRNK